MSAKNSTHDIASRYTTAFLALAEEKGVMTAITADMAGLKSMLAESADLNRLISNPQISRDAKSSAITAICKAAGASELTVNLLGVLADNRRLEMLPALVTFIQAEISRRRGEVVADVISAETLTDTQVAKLTEALKSALKADIKLNIAKDPSLLGGLIVRVGSRMIDLSVQSRLDRLHRALKSDISLDQQINSQKKEVA